MAEHTTTNMPAVVGNLLATKCCGVKEYDGINRTDWTPRKCICRILKHPQWAQPAHGKEINAGHAGYTFTMAWETEKEQPTMLARLKKFVDERELGTVTICPPGVSGLYGGHHMIQIGVFTPNRDNMIAWARKKGYFPETYKYAPVDPLWGACLWGGQGHPVL